MKTKGRVQGDEILQLTEAGIPATKILQEQLGLTADQVANIGDQGISADRAIKALLTGMDQRFGGMMQNQARTALGLMSTLKDTFENKILNQWGTGLWTGIKPGLLKVTDWLNKNDKKVTELGELFKKAGENVSTFIGGALEKSQERLDKLMDSSEWKNADLGGKIKLSWDTVIAQPFSEWWNGPGKPKINKVAEGMGSAIGGIIGGGILSFLDALGGKEDKVGGSGTSAGTAFTNAFLEAFDTGKIVDKLLESFKNANINALKNPNISNITKAGIMDYLLLGKLGGAKAIKGGTKAAKWFFGKGGASKTASTGKKAAGVAEEVANGAKGTSNASRASTFFKVAGKGIKGIPVAGGVISLLGSGIDIASSSDKGRGVSKALGNIGGGMAGAKLGGTLGSFFGPVGTGIGATAGGLIGSIGGSKLFSKIYSGGKSIAPQLGRKIQTAKRSVESKLGNTRTWFNAKIGIPIKNGAINTVNTTVGAFSLGKQKAQRVWAPYGQWLSTNVFTPISFKASQTGIWMGNKLGQGKSWAQSHWAGFTGWWSNNVSMPVQNVASNAGQWIGIKLGQGKEWAQNKWSDFSGWWSTNIATPTEDVASTVGDWIGQKFSAARKTAESAWSDFSEWFGKHISGPIGDFIKAAKNRGESKTGLKPSNGKIKKHANGGFTTGPELSIIGEAGTEAIIPLSSSRRNRGLSLWQQAGRMLGVGMFADGGIVGSGSDSGAGSGKKATANLSTTIVLGNDDSLNDFKQYGKKINDYLGNGITAEKKVPDDSMNKITNSSKEILNNFSQTGHLYGIAIDNDIAAGINSAMGNVTAVVKTLTDKVIAQFKEGFGIHSPSRVFYRLSQFIPQGMVNALKDSDIGAFIKKWVGDISSMASGAVGGNISGWLSAAMAMTGTPMSFLPMLENIAMHESGGNPRSINLWDSNAKAGHPSKGLMQMIDETFNRWALPGMKDIWNPIHNAVSAIRYMIGRYGSISNVPGIRSQLHGGGYVGYASGTDNAKKGLARINERGWEFVDFTGGEKVLNHAKSVSLMERAANSINRVKSAVFNLNSSRSIPENINPMQYTSHPQLAMAGTSYGDIKVDVNNNFKDDEDIDKIVTEAAKKFAVNLKAALQNIKG